MAEGQALIKSAYQYPYTSSHRYPNEARKANGIRVKVSGKKAIAAAEKEVHKVKIWSEEIGQLVLRNQNIRESTARFSTDGASRDAPHSAQ